MLTPLLFVEPHSTFIVCLTVFTVSLMVTSADGLVTSQHQSVVKWKKSVKMVPVPIPKIKNILVMHDFFYITYLLSITYELSDQQIFHQRSQELHTTTPKCSNNSYSSCYLCGWRSCCCCDYCAIDVDLTQSSELVLTMDFGCWCLCFADCCCKVTFVDVVVLFHAVGLVVYWAEVEVKSSSEREDSHHHQPL